MPAPNQTCFPSAFTAGETVRLQLTFGDYPASRGWSAALKLNKAGETVVSVAGSATGDGFLFVITAAVSALMAAGQWTWAARVTDGTDVKTAQAGDFTLLPDYSATIAKSTTQLQLEAANTAFSTLIADPLASVSFNGQSFAYSNRMELFDIIERLQAKVNQENSAAAGLRGDPPTRSIRPYFV